MQHITADSVDRLTSAILQVLRNGEPCADMVASLLTVILATT